MAIGDPITILFLILVGAFIGGQLALAVRLPQVLGYLVAGFLMGAPLLSSVFFSAGTFIEFFTEIGVVLLFFFVGIGMDIKNIRKMKKSATLGFWTSIIPFALGVGIGVVLGQSVIASLIIGIALSVSAQAITIHVLDESGLLQKRFGKDIVGAGVIADIIQLVAVSIVFGIIPSAASISFTTMILGWASFFVSLVVLKLLLIPAIVRFTDEENRTTFFTVSLIIAFLMGILGEMFGVSSILGALFAGVVIRQMFSGKLVGRLTRQLKIISFGLFIPVFFVWLGINVGFSGIIESFELGAVFAVLSIVGTMAGALIAVKVLKGDMDKAVASGWALQAKGDVELIVAAVAIEIGVISSGIFGAIIVMSALSMIVSPLFFYLSVSRMKQKGVKIR